jgi:DNA-binding MarR family transcriptional regulator
MIAQTTSLILQVFQLNGRLLAAGDRLVENLGLTSARWQVIGAIALAEEPQTVADIARSMGLTRQAIQRIANELIEGGLLERVENPRHLRSPLMRLTTRGQKAYDEASARQRPWVKRLAKDLSPREVDTALTVLQTLTDRLTSTTRATHAGRARSKR